MKKITLLSLLLVIVAPLLMGNAAYPYAYPQEYDAFTSTEIIVTEGGEDEDHTYSFTLTNIGEGYIELENSYLFSSTRGTIASFSDSYNELLGPAASIALTLTSDRLDLAPTINCYAFTGVIPDTTYTKLSPVLKEDQSYYNGDKFINFYKYSFTLKASVDKTYYYSVMITYEYEDTTNYTYYDGKVDNPIYFYRNDNLDESKMEIQNIAFIKGRLVNPFKGLATFFVVLGVIGLLSFVFYAVIVVGLIMLIVNQIKKKRAKTF
jgi:hypothetical protein